MTKPTRRGRSSGNSKSAQVRTLLAAGMKPTDIAKKVGCSTNLVYVVKSNAGGPRPRASKRRGPGRPAKATSGVDGLAGILAAVKNSERDRVAMRAALEKIQAVIADVLV